MRPQTLRRLKAFVGPYCVASDPLHDFTRIQCIVDTAQAIADTQPNIDYDLLLLAAYVHGIVEANAEEVRRFLADLGLQAPRIDRVLQVAHEGAGLCEPVTPEGAVLNDARLAPGGPAFTVIRAVAAGGQHGRSLTETAASLRDDLRAGHRCYTAKGRDWYDENRRYTRYFLNCVVPQAAPHASQQAAPAMPPQGPEAPAEAGEQAPEADAGNPYAGEPTVALICPWCNEEARLPDRLLGNDVLCPACLEVIYLAPALGTGRPIRATRSDLESFPRRPRCPRCRSRAIWRPPLWIAGVALIVVAVAWLLNVVSNGPVLIHPYADPFASLALVLAGVEMLLHRPLRRCAACGLRWR